MTGEGFLAAHAAGLAWAALGTGGVLAGLGAVAWRRERRPARDADTAPVPVITDLGRPGGDDPGGEEAALFFRSLRNPAEGGGDVTLVPAAPPPAESEWLREQRAILAEWSARAMAGIEGREE